ncbi:MAG TPA: Xaa-Pro peptidase family protein [Chloroflexota bacterium]|nr:Xaa-Pro peptidase family protein [Chloroflexota bacterium]
MTARMEQFQGRLADLGLAGAVVNRPEHVFYLVGFTTLPRSLSFLVTGPRGVALVTRGNEALSRNLDSGLQVFPYEFYRPRQLRAVDEVVAEALRAACEAVGLRGGRIGVEASNLPWNVGPLVDGYGEIFPFGGTIESMRVQKDDDEIAAIRRAVAINDLGLAAAQRAIRAGASELDVYSAVYREVLLRHGLPFTLQGDFVSGPRTERIGGPATARRLETGDLFIIDIFPVLNWYKGDFTRTFVVGRPSERQKEMHLVLEAALAAGAAAIRPGLPACDLDAVVRNTIADAGYGDYFPHHAGHAIGLDHPEPPFIIPADPTPLQPRMVITLEPGIYVPGFGGMRLEQNYLVTENRAEPLSAFPLELTECR